MLKRFLTVAIAVLLAACARNPAGATQDGLRVQPDGDAAITVTNPGDQPVYYLIFNPEALASWAPCTSPAECPEIEPGETVRIPYAEIGLYQPDSTQAELRWWRFVRAADGGYRVERAGELVVRL